MGYALITGASAGIGADFARLFAKDSHSLVLVARRRDRLESLAAELKAQNSAIDVVVIDMDLSSKGAATQLFQDLQKRNIFINFLVNNAGFGSNGAFSKLPLNKELEMIDLNVRVLTELTHLFLQPMIQKKSGHILNVGSTAGFQPGPYMATYYASKAYVNSFSEALSEELKGTGVSCSVLAPGATATEFFDTAKMKSAIMVKNMVLASSTQVAKLGYEGMKNKKALIIAGCLNSILVFSVRFSPRWLVRKIAATINKQ